MVKVSLSELIMKAFMKTLHKMGILSLKKKDFY